MKILTFNTWQERGPWRERWALTLSFLKEQKPEIVCFQEVFNPSWAEEVKHLTGYPYLVFNPEPSGLMILSSWPVAESACLTMKTRSQKEDYLRYALYAAISSPGKEIAVFNTHLSWKPQDTPIRQAQVQELTQFIQEKAGQKTVFVTGDFNAAPETPEIALMTRAGFSDLFAETCPGNPGLTWNNTLNVYAAGSSSKLPDRRIDYLFFKDPLGNWPKPTSVQVVLTKPDSKGVLASDHFGVLAEFSS